MAGTVTLMVASAMLGSMLAWTTVEPPGPTTPVMGTETLLLAAGIVIVAGTVAKLVLSECRFMVSALGVIAERVRVAFCVEFPGTVMLPCPKLTVAVTLTVALLDPKPAPDALMAADPTATPVT